MNYKHIQNSCVLKVLGRHSLFAETFTAKMAENFNMRVGEKNKSQILGIQTTNKMLGEFIYCSKVLITGGS